MSVKQRHLSARLKLPTLTTGAPNLCIRIADIAEDKNSESQETHSFIRSKAFIALFVYLARKEDGDRALNGHGRSLLRYRERGIEGTQEKRMS